MDRKEFEIDRRTLLRATTATAAIPVGAAATTGAETDAGGTRAGSGPAAGGHEADHAPGRDRSPLFTYAGLAVAGGADTDGTGGRGERGDANDDGNGRLGYGEHGYGGIVP